MAESDEAGKLLGIPVSSIGGNVAIRESEVVPASDFAKTLHAAMRAVSNQLNLAASPPESSVTLREMEIAKHKTNCAMHAVSHIPQLQSMQELLTNDHLKFKREEEMKAMHALLAGLGLSAEISRSTLEVIQKKIAVELESDEPDMEVVAKLQDAHLSCLGALEKAVNATQKTIRLERDSGHRIADRKADVGKNLAISYLANLDRTPEVMPGNPVGTTVEIVEEPAKETISESGMRKLSAEQMVTIVGQGLVEAGVPVKEDIKGVENLVDLAAVAPVSFPFKPIGGALPLAPVPVIETVVDDFDMDPADEFSILDAE